MKKLDWKIPYSRPCVSRGLLEAGLSPLLCQVLALRGIDTPEKARAMLYGGAECVYDPLLILGMREARDRVLRALRDDAPFSRRVPASGVEEADLRIMLRELG